MNKAEAAAIIEAELAKYREWTYEQLSAIAEAPKQSLEVTGASGTTYDVDARSLGREVGGNLKSDHSDHPVVLNPYNETVGGVAGRVGSQFDHNRPGSPADSRK